MCSRLRHSSIWSHGVRVHAHTRRHAVGERQSDRVCELLPVECGEI